MSRRKKGPTKKQQKRLRREAERRGMTVEELQEHYAIRRSPSARQGPR